VAALTSPFPFAPWTVGLIDLVVDHGCSERGTLVDAEPVIKPFVNLLRQEADQASISDRVTVFISLDGGDNHIEICDAEVEIMTDESLAVYRLSRRLSNECRRV